MKSLAILGASGHGKVVADTATLCGWSEITFFDDAWPAREACGTWNVAGDTATLRRDVSRFDGFFVAIGDNAVRLQKAQEIAGVGGHLVSLVHPSSTVSKLARVGLGSLVAAGAIIQVDAEIGLACIINTGATVDHDCVVEHGVHVSPGANLAGAVHVGAMAWVGVGASVIQQLKIGRCAIVGAGSVVIHDVLDSTTVVGVPAKPLNHYQ